MAVVSVNLIGQGASDGLDESTLRDTYRVIVDDPQDTAFTVSSNASVPKIWDTNASDTDYYVVRVDPEQQDNRLEWLVTVEYSNNLRGQLENPNDNPLNEPWLRRWGNITSSLPIYQDINGDPIDNSAREQFDPPIEREFKDPVLYVTRNEPYFDADVPVEYQDAVNTDTFYGAAAGLAKIAEITADEQFKNGVRYWRVTYEIHFRADGWKRKILDAGFTKLDGANQVTITDANGVPLSAPSYLNGSGAVASTPTFLEFEIYQAKAFAPLGLEF